MIYSGRYHTVNSTQRLYGEVLLELSQEIRLVVQ